MNVQASILREFDRRRSEPRHRLALPVFVETGKGLFDGEMLNISRGGALLRVPDGAFGLGPDDGPETAEYAERVRETIADGIGVHLFCGVLRITGEVVRVSNGSRGGARSLLLGCRFVAPPEFGAWHPRSAAIEEPSAAPPPPV